MSNINRRIVMLTILSFMLLWSIIIMSVVFMLLNLFSIITTVICLIFDVVQEKKNKNKLR